jgi:hypothetical protein
MNMVKAIVMVVTFGMAGIALAEGGADRTFARMEAAPTRSRLSGCAEKKEQAPVAAQSSKHVGHELLIRAYRNVISRNLNYGFRLRPLISLAQ